MREQKYFLRAHIHTAFANQNDQERKDRLANLQLSTSVDPTIDISVTAADEDSESVHEAERAGMIKHEYLL
jgi:ectoine hydroxylase-related dioxygenase (phytanoyl-CoA dioxygenase family)